MCVPAQDDRDFAFATKFNIPNYLSYCKTLVKKSKILIQKLIINGKYD